MVKTTYTYNKGRQNKLKAVSEKLVICSVIPNEKRHSISCINVAALFRNHPCDPLGDCCTSAVVEYLALDDC